MGKKLIHASHFTHSLAKRSPKRYNRLKPIVDTDEYRIDSTKPVKDKRLWKYWKNRKHLFSKINENQIYMTSELWFSVTPESIARFITQFIMACLPKAICIMDVFSGGGGNSIQFASAFPRVIGVDNNLEHLYCTAMNSRAYGVENHLWLKYGNWSSNFIRKNYSWMQKEKIDCIFASPPWGGPEYLKSKVYDLENMLIPMGITPLLQSFKQLTHNIILFLPRNSDLKQISQATNTVFGAQALCKVLYVKDNGYMKGMLCMWGEPFVNYQTEDENIVDVSEMINSDSDDGSNSKEAGREASEVKKSVVGNSDLYDING